MSGRLTSIRIFLADGAWKDQHGVTLKKRQDAHTEAVP